MSRKGNKNVITGSQNIADANVTGSLVYLNNGAVKLKSGLGKLASNTELESAIKFRNSFKNANAASALNTFFSEIESKFKSFRYANDSILFWVVKKKYSYREIVRYSSTGSAFTQGFLSRIVPQGLTRFASEAATSLQNFANNPLVQAGSSVIGVTPTDLGTADLNNFNDVTSDSIGVMANTKYMQLDSTLPLIDITQERYGVPIPFSASSENKISPTTRNIMYNLSKFNTALMRRNLIPVAYGNTTVTANLAVDATLAHGVNLINDLPTFVKLNAGIGALLSALVSVITNPRIFQYISYLSNIGNKSGFNYRDNRPAMASDKDFIVLKGEEQAAGIVDEIKEMASMAQAQAAIQKIAQGDFIRDFFSAKQNTAILPSGTTIGGQQSNLVVRTDDQIGGADGEILYTTGNGVATTYTDAKDRFGNTIGQDTPSGALFYLDVDKLPPEYLVPVNKNLDKVYPGQFTIKAPLVAVVSTSDGRQYRMIINDVGTGGQSIQGQRRVVDLHYKSARDLSGNPNFAVGQNSLYNITNVRVEGFYNNQTLGFLNAPSTQARANVGAITNTAQTIRQAQQEILVGDTVVEPALPGDDFIRMPGEVGTRNNTASSPGSVTTNNNLPTTIVRGQEVVDIFALMDEGVTEDSSTLEATLLPEGTPLPVDTQLSEDVSQPVTGTPSSTPTATQGSAVPAPGFNNVQTTQQTQVQASTSLIQDAVSLMSGLGSGKFSNRQTADIFTFFINVEGVYQKVDYLLKSVRTGFNPSKAIQQRLSTTAATAASNRLDTSSPATAAAQLSLLGVPEGLADATSALIGGIFDNDQSNDVITGLISDKYNDYIDGAMENPIAQTITGYYDGAAGSINQLGGLLGADPTLGPLLPTSSELIDVLDPGTFFEGLEIPSILPSVDLGSIKDLLSLAASVATSGPPTSLTGFIKMQEQLYSIICNFQLPIIDFPAIEALLKMDFKELDQKIKEMVERFITRIIDRFNIVKLLKQLNKTFKETLEQLKKQFIKQFLSCEKYKKADKSGKPSAGG